MKSAPVDETEADDAEAGPDLKRDSTLQPAGRDSVPEHRPWVRRPDPHRVELRFRRDRTAWRRRIDCARRLTHDGRDELVVPNGA